MTAFRSGVSSALAETTPPTLARWAKTLIVIRRFSLPSLPMLLSKTARSSPTPPETENFHYEIELVVGIGKAGKNIAEADVPQHIWGATVGIDLTRRDLQLAARDKGRPWDWGKAFDQSAPLAPLVPMAEVPSLSTGRIWLAVNGQVKQDANIADLIWSVNEHIAILSQSMTLAPGDIIMTGTPAGVGAIVPGDTVTGAVDGLAEIQITIGDRV
jgi:fumarylpyruvate hydrolase